MSYEALSSNPLILVYHEKRAKEFADELTNRGFSRVLAAHDVSTAIKWIDQVEIMLAWRPPIELYEHAPHLKWIQWMGAGVEEVVGKLQSHTVLTRVVGQFGHAMAEYAFAWLLHVYQGVERYQTAKKEQVWKPYVNQTLQGRTLGVAGLGSIGKQIVSVGQAFGMNTIGLSLTGAHKDIVNKHFSPDEWSEFAALSDVLIVTLPHTLQTENSVGEHVFKSMKQDAIFMNIGRGKVVDEAALIQTLEKGSIRAAILDVFAVEPLPLNHPFWGMPNVYMTPHISGPSRVSEVVEFFVNNYNRYVECTPLEGLVDKQKGY